LPNSNVILVALLLVHQSTCHHLSSQHGRDCPTATVSTSSVTHLWIWPQSAVFVCSTTGTATLVLAIARPPMALATAPVGTTKLFKMCHNFWTSVMGQRGLGRGCAAASVNNDDDDDDDDE